LAKLIPVHTIKMIRNRGGSKNHQGKGKGHGKGQGKGGDWKGKKGDADQEVDMDTEEEEEVDEVEELVAKIAETTPAEGTQFRWGFASFR
jgi:hypothetical protein